MSSPDQDLCSSSPKSFATAPSESNLGPDEPEGYLPSDVGTIPDTSINGDPKEDEDDLKEYEVEDILKERVVFVNGGEGYPGGYECKEYYVSWVGYTENDNQWLPEDNFNDGYLIKAWKQIPESGREIDNPHYDPPLEDLEEILAPKKKKRKTISGGRGNPQKKRRKTGDLAGSDSDDYAPAKSKKPRSRRSSKRLSGVSDMGKSIPGTPAFSPVNQPTPEVSNSSKNIKRKGSQNRVANLRTRASLHTGIVLEPYRLDTDGLNLVQAPNPPVASESTSREQEIAVNRDTVMAIVEDEPCSPVPSTISILSQTVIQPSPVGSTNHTPIRPIVSNQPPRKAIPKLSSPFRDKDVQTGALNLPDRDNQEPPFTPPVVEPPTPPSTSISNSAPEPPRAPIIPSFSSRSTSKSTLPRPTSSGPPPSTSKRLNPIPKPAVSKPPQQTAGPSTQRLRTAHSTFATKKTARRPDRSNMSSEVERTTQAYAQQHQSHLIRQAYIESLALENSSFSQKTSFEEQSVKNIGLANLKVQSHIRNFLRNHERQGLFKSFKGVKIVNMPNGGRYSIWGPATEESSDAPLRSQLEVDNIASDGPDTLSLMMAMLQIGGADMASSPDGKGKRKEKAADFHSDDQSPFSPILLDAHGHNARQVSIVFIHRSRLARRPSLEGESDHERRGLSQLPGLPKLLDRDKEQPGSVEFILFGNADERGSEERVKDIESIMAFGTIVVLSLSSLLNSDSAALSSVFDGAKDNFLVRVCVHPATVLRLRALVAEGTKSEVGAIRLGDGEDQVTIKPKKKSGRSVLDVFLELLDALGYRDFTAVDGPTVHLLATPNVLTQNWSARLRNLEGTVTQTRILDRLIATPVPSREEEEAELWKSLKKIRDGEFDERGIKVRSWQLDKMNTGTAVRRVVCAVGTPEDTRSIASKTTRIGIEAMAMKRLGSIPSQVERLVNILGCS